jgi:C1A family cysteine protease
MPHTIEIPGHGKRGMGWHPSPPDHRDHQADASGIKVLTLVDPRAEMPSIYDQLQIGSCTAHADKRVIEYDRVVRGEELLDIARNALYTQERVLEGQDPHSDTGAYGRDGFKANKQFGTPTEKEFGGYTDDTSDPRFFTDPEHDSKLDPSKFVKLKSPYKVVPQTEDQMKAVLSNKQMVSLGASLYESFESSEVANTGIVPVPGRDEQIIGGHQFVVIGYLPDMLPYALCANSWGSLKTDGTKWGVDGEGCFFMPWTYLTNPRLVSDIRTIPHSVKA